MDEFQNIFDDKEGFLEDDIVIPFDFEDEVPESLGDDTFREMEPEGADDVEFDIPTFKKQDDEIAREVEDTFISLIAAGNSDLILQISGESPRRNTYLSQELDADISKKYAKAVQYNPAIRWYSKLIKLTDHNGFKVSNGNLSLKLNKNTFKSVLKPNISDFQAQFEEDSEIVSLVRSLYESQTNTELSDKYQMMEDQKKTCNSFGDDDLFVDEFEGGDYEDDDLISFDDIVGDRQRSIDVDENGPTFDDDDNKVAETHYQSKFNISLKDFGHKAIAEFFNDQGVTDYNDVQAVLEEEGFDRNSRQQIVSIMKYINVNKGLSSIMPKGNKSPESVNFDMEG